MLANWLLYKKAGHPGGQRLPKRVPFVEPKTAIVPTGYYHRVPKVYQTSNGDEHRFWAITEGGTYRCRACEADFWLEADRKLHLSHEGCAKKLVAAYKLLLRDMRCVVCDQRCTLTRWGVPLCMGNTNCVDRWLKESNFAALSTALTLVEMKGGW